MTRMTMTDVMAHQKRVRGEMSVPAGNRSKYRNVRCEANDGTSFASMLERDYYEKLLLRKLAGDIQWFTRQVPFWLEGGVKYICDFVVVERPTAVVVVDCKGYQTQDSKNKFKQMKARYGIEVHLVRSV